MPAVLLLSHLAEALGVLAVSSRNYIGVVDHGADFFWGMLCLAAPGGSVLGQTPDQAAVVALSALLRFAAILED